jgi:hypothetical protein
MSAVFYRIDDSPNALSFAAAHSRSDFFNLGSEYIMGCLEAMMTILSKKSHWQLTEKMRVSFKDQNWACLEKGCINVYFIPIGTSVLNFGLLHWTKPFS